MTYRLQPGQTHFDHHPRCLVDEHGVLDGLADLFTELRVNRPDLTPSQAAEELAIIAAWRDRVHQAIDHNRPAVDWNDVATRQAEFVARVTEQAVEKNWSTSTIKIMLARGVALHQDETIPPSEVPPLPKERK